jgi:hypothetical protein
MARGTWQGAGTWQSSGPDLDGLIVPVVIAAVFVAVVEFVLSIIVWLAVAAGIVLVIAAGGLIWWLRGAPKRKAEYAALYAAAFEAHRAVTATATPQVTQGTAPPAIEYHVHHHYAAGQEPARVIPGKVMP